MSMIFNMPHMPIKRIYMPRDSGFLLELIMQLNPVIVVICALIALGAAIEVISMGGIHG